MTVTIDEGLHHLRVDLLDVDPVNPRAEPGDVTDLAASIADIGIVNPLVVRPAGDRYGVLSGSRRRAAAIAAGLDEVPCLVKRPPDDTAALAIATAENVGRNAMNPIEEARAFRRLLDDTGCTQRELGARIGVSEFTVSVRLQLLGLPDDVQTQIAAGELTVSSAYRQLKKTRGPQRRRRRSHLDGIPADMAKAVTTAAARRREPPEALVARAIRRELADPSCRRCERRPPASWGAQIHCPPCAAAIGGASPRGDT